MKLTDFFSAVEAKAAPSNSLFEIEENKEIDSGSQFLVKKIVLSKDDLQRNYFLIELRDEKKAKLIDNILFGSNSIREEEYHKPPLKIKIIFLPNSPKLIHLKWDRDDENDLLEFMEELQSNKIISTHLFKEIKNLLNSAALSKSDVSLTF